MVGDGVGVAVEAATPLFGGKVFPGALICALPSMTWQFSRQTSLDRFCLDRKLNLHSTHETWSKDTAEGERLTTVSQKAWQGSLASLVEYGSGVDEGMMGVSDDDDNAAAGNKVAEAAFGMTSISEEVVSEPAVAPVEAGEAVTLPKD